MATFPDLKNPFILAPMAGITDDAFRRLCLEQGAALAYSEMVSAKALHYNDAKSLELLRRAPDAGSVAYQLFGSEPEIMAEAVRKLDELERAAVPDGATGKIISCIAYDVNMGCPVNKVVRNGEGSALMRDPDLAARIVEAMVQATDKPVTVKTRAGWDAQGAEAGAAVELARAVVEAGAAAVAVHGRTREQFYGGRADRDAIARVKDAVNVPVIGSGDVMSAQDAVRMLTETGCDYVMVARGALGNPWIFSDAVGLPDGAEQQRVDIEQRAAMFIRHARLEEADKGGYIAVREMRKHAGWYFKGLPGVTALRARVNTITTMEELERAVREMVTAMSARFHIV
jgi:tRNA-dihydrouridine synthase B